MSEKKSKKRSLFTIFAFLAAIAGALLISYSMASTCTTDYCMSCHEMKNYRDELKKLSHALDKNKVPIECGQCHVPNTFGLKYVATKSILGMKDMGVHYLGDPTSWARRVVQPYFTYRDRRINVLLAESQIVIYLKRLQISQLPGMQAQSRIDEMTMFLRYLQRFYVRLVA